MARPRGTGGRPQAKTAAAKAQRHAAAAQSRPGRRPLDDDEQASREDAVRIGRSLNGRLMRLIERRVEHAERVEAEVERELAQPHPDHDWIIYLRSTAPSAGELAQLAGQVWDRFGQPRRSVQDLVLKDSPPIMVFAGDAPESWRKREEEHAALAGRNGHDRGDSS